MQVLKARAPARSIVDFGCGEAAFIQSMLLDPEMQPPESVAGVDISPTGLMRARRLMALTMLKRQELEWRGLPLPALQLYEVRAPVVSGRSSTLHLSGPFLDVASNKHNKHKHSWILPPSTIVGA
jgi:hypothetical protein